MQQKLEELKKKAEADYQNKLKKLESEYQKNLSAIDRVFALLGTNKSDTATDLKEVATQQIVMATSQDVSKIIGGLNGEWSVVDIRKRASELNPPLEVTKNVFHNVIKRKRERNEIEMVVKGAGRSPAIYRNVESKKDIPTRMIRFRKKNDGYKNNEGSGSTQHPEPSS